MVPTSLYPELEITTFGIDMTLADKMPLSFYTGSTWRGVVGWEMKRLSCLYHVSEDCQGCQLSQDCPYYILFEKRTSIPGIFNSPRGYVLFVPERGNENSIQLRITLMGYCCRFMPALLQSLARAQDKGLGRNRINFSIRGISEDTPEEVNCIDPGQDILAQFKGPFNVKAWLADINDSPSGYHLHLPTPMRLRQKGKYLSDLDLKFMFLTLVKRLEALACIYSDGQPLGKERWLETRDYFASLDDLDVIEKDILNQDKGIWKKLRWDDYARFSNRQKKKVPMGGLTGECFCKCDLPGLGKWIKCAELLHVGKGASMGLGRIQKLEQPEALI